MSVVGIEDEFYVELFGRLIRYYGANATSVLRIRTYFTGKNLLIHRTYRLARLGVSDHYHPKLAAKTALASLLASVLGRFAFAIAEIRTVTTLRRKRSEIAASIKLNEPQIIAIKITPQKGCGVRVSGMLYSAAAKLLDDRSSSARVERQSDTESFLSRRAL